MNARALLLSRVAVVTAGALLAAACGGAVTTTSPRSIRGPSAQNVRGPFVPAGATVAVRIDTPLDTLQSGPGAAFQATVITPLRSPDGVVVVPQGARVTGRLVSTGNPSSPHLRLDLEQVETTRGPAALEARVRRAERQRYPGPTTWVPGPATGPGWYGPGWGAGYGSFYSSGFYGPIGGGPTYEPFTPSEVHLPRGATVTLQLTRAVIPPGTSVVR